MIRIKVNHARVQNEYFELLNPRNKDGSYSEKEALIKSIEEEAAKAAYSPQQAQDFFDFVKDEANLRNILLASATNLASVKSNGSNKSINKAKELYEDMEESERAEVRSYFETRYETLRNKSKFIKFFQEVTQIHVCPYCNINHTYSVEIIKGGKQTNKKHQALFQLDHFYDKATYPYLALSFYNLVPSCSTCNTSCKGSKELELNPYISGVEDEYIFRTKLKSADYFAYNPDSFEIKLSQNKAQNSNFETNKEVLGLEARYALHKAEVIDLIKKGIIYNESYLASLYEQYRDTVFSSEQEVKRLVLGNYLHPEDFHKRPLSKLTRDIAQELGLL